MRAFVLTMSGQWCRNPHYSGINYAVISSRFYLITTQYLFVILNTALVSFLIGIQALLKLLILGLQ